MPEFFGEGPGKLAPTGEASTPTDPADIDTSLDLNQRGDGRPQVHIDIPVYGGGMSFGSVSIHTILAKARAPRPGTASPAPARAAITTACGPTTTT